MSFKQVMKTRFLAEDKVSFKLTEKPELLMGDIKEFVKVWTK